MQKQENSHERAASEGVGLGDQRLAHPAAQAPAALSAGGALHARSRAEMARQARRVSQPATVLILPIAPPGYDLNRRRRDGASPCATKSTTGWPLTGLFSAPTFRIGYSRSRPSRWWRFSSLGSNVRSAHRDGRHQRQRSVRPRLSANQMADPIRLVTPAGC